VAVGVEEEPTQAEDFETTSSPHPSPEVVETVDTPLGRPVGRRQMLPGVAALATALGTVEPAKAEQEKDWQLYDLNTGEILYDIEFDEENPLRGFLVGGRGLFYSTEDGGKKWTAKRFPQLGNQGIQYRFQSVSVRGQEVWILGKPPILLHSKDGGKSWTQLAISRKLPGVPRVLTVLGPGKAEMATSSGAVYQTDNDGQNWNAMVKETVDATLNRISSSGIKGGSYFTGSVKTITRDKTGKYLAVASRGNFYLTWSPGEEYSTPHNRVSARRIQAMGFRSADDATNVDETQKGAWMTLNGGQMMLSDTPQWRENLDDTDKAFKNVQVKAGGYGIIDCAWRTAKEAWAVGGSGIIYKSSDNGQTWSFDSSGNDLPCNLYTVKFFNNGKLGFMIGSAGILLRRQFA